jgi:hypothetical protein
MYSLRHTFAADLATKGFSLEHIGALLGQRDPRSTKIYAHLMPAATDGIVQALSVPAPWGRESGPDAKVLRFVPREALSTEDEHAAQ